MSTQGYKNMRTISQNRVYCVEKKVSAININAGIIGQYHYQNIYFLSSLLLWLSVTCNSTDNTNTTLAEKKLQNTLKKKHSHSVPVLSCQKIEAEEHRINIKHTTYRPSSVDRDHQAIRDSRYNKVWYTYCRVDCETTRYHNIYTHTISCIELIFCSLEWNSLSLSCVSANPYCPTCEGNYL